VQRPEQTFIVIKCDDIAGGMVDLVILCIHMFLAPLSSGACR